MQCTKHCKKKNERGEDGGELEGEREKERVNGIAARRDETSACASRHAKKSMPARQKQRHAMFKNMFCYGVRAPCLLIDRDMRKNKNVVTITFYR